MLQKEGGKYGLLLCYGGDATDVAVYVGDMEENTVADVSGKIMVGDQIVQVRQRIRFYFPFWTSKLLMKKN